MNAETLARALGAGNGDPGRSRPGREPTRVKKQCPGTPSKVAPGACCASCRAHCGSRTGGWSSERSWRILLVDRRVWQYIGITV